MIRDLFVTLQGGAADTAALEAAIALARAHEARVAALAAVIHPVPVASEWGLSAAGLTAADFQAARDAAGALADRANVLLERAGVPHEVRLVDAPLAWPEEVAALHARHADLSIYGGLDPEARNPRFELGFDALLVHGGRPVLLVPPAADAPVAAPARRVVLAWQPRREATRAVHDALPLLAKDAHVEVVVVDAEPGLLGHGDQPGADIALHLARHGVDVRVVSLHRHGRATGRVLLDHARDVRADLLVMGGFSHARWRQQVFGGATRTVLAQATLPVLFSH